jgi:hypothetical protein
MESSDHYNFSIFSPRNHHGKKNRNVIISMLFIWAIAVFGFQFLLLGIQKSTPEKALTMFETTWPAVLTGNFTTVGYKTFLNSLVLVKGKNVVKPGDQKVLSDAISCITFKVVPDSVKTALLSGISDLKSLKTQLVQTKDQEYLEIKKMIGEKNKALTDICAPYSDFRYGSLEAAIFINSLEDKYPESFDDISFTSLPEIMKLYLTHNQSKLTDSKFLGFPFHYFYTAVFLLILFITLCLTYNILIEWRLRKDSISE